ncbi:MAG: exo-alpha-sialidase, partial [Bacteroidales bacterium]|nr:exo-alpha-sialidase [Bacteroidales bacterium]
MKKHFFVKRIVIVRVVLVAVLSFLIQGYGNIVKGQEMKGITGITKGSVDLAIPPDPFLGKACHYTVGWSIQVAPRKAALICGRFLSGTGNIDFIDGADLILFDDLANISSDKPIPLTRNIRIPGDSTIIIKGFPIGGFVPFGAKQKDGSAHPYAGTGFGLSYNSVKGIDLSGHFDYQKSLDVYYELFQFTYNEKGFKVIKKERVEKNLLSGWDLSQVGVSSAIPDGNDLLVGMTTRFGNLAVSGIARWRYKKNGWRPVSFIPITGYEDSWGEPSLIRDIDGNLLFSARGSGNENFNVAVWRSLDNGETWKQVIHQKNYHARSPISINRAVDGTPYIAANLFPKSRTREILCLWPLNADRTELGELYIARDARGQFGPAPSGSWWRVDHPISSVLRLADGKWHGILAYHIVDNGEVEGFGSLTP